MSETINGLSKWLMVHFQLIHYSINHCSSKMYGNSQNYLKVKNKTDLKLLIIVKKLQAHQYIISYQKTNKL